MILEDVLPNLKSGGLQTTGFLFGAGTSLEAGYPMMAGLTKSVVGALNTAEKSALDEVLNAAGRSYNPSWGDPNVEVIADLVISHAISSAQTRFYDLETRLRELVTDIILSVKKPTLDLHVQLLESLKKRAFGAPACVHIFSTNYDLLFEMAGAEAGVVIETGFVGSVERFFDPQRFALSCGRRVKANFAEHPVLTVRLIKLHGSVSWFGRDGRFFERHPDAIDPTDRRVMILPRRRKVMETLHAPHDALFTAARNALGAECKYVASCGFSFGDDHINENLLTPLVNGGGIRLFALCDKETDGMAALKTAGAFNAGFDTGGIAKGVAHTTGTDCWKFSKFVEMFK
ncbi:SIR2 family protein [Sphingobium sp. CR2-8]|uniref:SIR2 family protein n=1 Tax=Sphingobium sp. CR2-8 TaxID=1306534 RepID=UPI002DB6F8A2|nr:SIR2 family protein [Sphingobium sp. CR2-8]MEC3909687.1 SIR2 family protein [Sphingobium sp. CR2-8]